MFGNFKLSKFQDDFTGNDLQGFQSHNNSYTSQPQNTSISPQQNIPKDEKNSTGIKSLKLFSQSPKKRESD